MTSSYTQLLLEREIDNATIKRLLSNLQEQVERLLPPVQVRYIPYTDRQYTQMIKRANHRAARSFGLKTAVPIDEIANVVDRLKLENLTGLPLYANSKGVFEMPHYESDLFAGEYQQGWIAPRALNMSLIQANTIAMTKQHGKYVARIRVNNHSLHLGHYYHQDAAERVYRLAKSLVLQVTANHYRDHLPDRVYRALVNYQVW